MPVEQMSNEARMSIKLMSGPQPGDDILGPNRGSMKQATMEEILLKAQRMYQMSQAEQQQEVAKQIESNPMAKRQVDQM